MTDGIFVNKLFERDSLSQLDNVLFILISGRSGSGKSTLKEYLIKSLSDEKTKVIPVPFAGLVKYLAYKHFGLVFEKDIPNIPLFKWLYEHDYIFSNGEPYSNSSRKLTKDEFVKVLFFVARSMMKQYETILITAKGIMYKYFPHMYSELQTKLSEVYPKEYIKKHVLFGGDIREELLRYLSAFEIVLSDVISELYNAYVDVNIRRFLQLFATEFMKEIYGQDIWTLMHMTVNVGAGRTIKECKVMTKQVIFIVDDVRFHTEHFYVKYLHRNVFKYLGVNANVVHIGLRAKDENVFNHASENEINDILKYTDIVYENKKTGIDEFKTILEFVKTFISR